MGETLVTGSLRFKDKILVAKRKEIVRDFGNKLEAKIKWDQRWKECTYQDVNWSSHVSMEEVKEVFDKYKELLSFFEASLYYLSDSDESIYYDEKVENGEVRVSLI